MNFDMETQKAALTEQVIAILKKQLGPGKAKMAARYVELSSAVSQSMTSLQRHRGRLRPS